MGWVHTVVFVCSRCRSRLELPQDQLSWCTLKRCTGHQPPATCLPAPAVDEHFDAIMAELLKEIGGRLWRSRQASCLALADLLVGRRWAQVGGAGTHALPAVALLGMDVKIQLTQLIASDGKLAAAAALQQQSGSCCALLRCCTAKC